MHDTTPLKHPSQVDCGTVDEVTRKEWQRAGFKGSSKRLPQIIGRKYMNKFPKKVCKRYPHQTKGFDVLGRFNTQPTLAKLWFPVTKLHLGYDAGRFLKETFYGILNERMHRYTTKHEAEPTRILARYVLSIVCKYCGGFNALQRILKSQDGQKLKELLSATRRRSRERKTLRGVQDATWMLE